MILTEQDVFDTVGSPEVAVGCGGGVARGGVLGSVFVVVATAQK